MAKGDVRATAVSVY